MRYHLWFTRISRNGPYGVRDSSAVTGEPGLSPTARWAVRAAAPRCIHGKLLSLISPNRGLSRQESVPLLLLFLTLCKLYHSFLSLSTPFSRWRRYSRNSGVFDQYVTPQWSKSHCSMYSLHS